MDMRKTSTTALPETDRALEQLGVFTRSVRANDAGQREPDEEENQELVKLRRAQGGCLGTDSRSRTRQAAKSHGEEQISDDPWMSEWGNPAGVNSRSSVHE